uniref:RdRp n=1 Tax=viral metagenome TaxID=1070528 RepID=A0A2V0RAC1_9ZZZZ
MWSSPISSDSEILKSTEAEAQQFQIHELTVSQLRSIRLLGQIDNIVDTIDQIDDLKEVDVGKIVNVMVTDTQEVQSAAILHTKTDMATVTRWAPKSRAGNEVILRFKSGPLSAAHRHELVNYLRWVGACQEQIDELERLIEYCDPRDRSKSIRNHNIWVTNQQPRRLCYKWKIPDKPAPNTHKADALRRVEKLLDDTFLQFQDSSMLREAVQREVEQAHDLAGYTQNDPRDVCKRFKHYIQPRIKTFDTEEMIDAWKIAKRVKMKRFMKVNGGKIKVYKRLSDITARTLREELQSGSAGEYKSFGVDRRNDLGMCAAVVEYLERVQVEAERVVNSNELCESNIRLNPLTELFGKEEPKAKKRLDREIIDSVARLIFNGSPFVYIVDFILFGEVSKRLKNMSHHGPGYGPTRGGTEKLKRFINRSFTDNPRCVTTEHDMTNSDYNKFDASLKECILKWNMDYLKDTYDYSALDLIDQVAYEILHRVALENILSKLVKHVSGVHLFLHGCMPSGAFLTSTGNTEMNDGIVISHIAMQMLHDKRWSELSSNEVADLIEEVIEDTIISYGDNQIFSELPYVSLGIKRDFEDFVEYAARFGMTMKPDETVVTKHLSACAYCSRKPVKMPNGEIIVTRTAQQYASKVMSRPNEDPVLSAIYIRALLSDNAGTDPLGFQFLQQVDKRMDINDASITAKLRALDADTLKKLRLLYDTENMDVIKVRIMQCSKSRAYALDLLRPLTRDEKKYGSNKFGTDGSVELTRGIIRSMIEASPVPHLFCKTATWYKYLGVSNQLGIYCERDDGLEGARLISEAMLKEVTYDSVVEQMEREIEELDDELLDELVGDGASVCDYTMSGETFKIG